jgi:hypothetical protein
MVYSETNIAFLPMPLAPIQSLSILSLSTSMRDATAKHVASRFNNQDGFFSQTNECRFRPESVTTGTNK